MPFVFKRLEIPDLILIEPKVFEDERGFSWKLTNTRISNMRWIAAKLRVTSAGGPRCALKRG
jgi:dTDP-4-dehydrorhamnose 3,5-epimerase-like enzyme